MAPNGQPKKRGSEHPYLAGNFAPLTTTNTPTPCKYTGTIPSELLGGEYVRNGGNPVSNADLGRDAHWFDGDGMLAGVLFQRSPSNSEETIPHFVNQYILTDLYVSAVENPSLRTPILPSIATLVSSVASLFVILYRIMRAHFLVLLSHLPGSKQAIKRISVANTGILFHDGRALATCESGPPIRIQLPGLETVGWFNGNSAEGEPAPAARGEKEEEVLGGTGLFSWMKEWTTGHPKVDPNTGDLVLFHCNFLPPYVHYSVIPSTPSGSFESPATKLLNAPVPGCSGGKMMHDFGVSLNHTVILDLPLSLTPFNLAKNQPVVSYQPEKNARFGVFPRHDPAKVRWFETSGCCIFHTANTWDQRDSSGTTVAVNLLACRQTSASAVFSAGNLMPPPHPKRKMQEERRPISFFARYDEDEDTADLERSSANEKDPLLGSERSSAGRDTASTSKKPPILDDDEEQCRLYFYSFSLTSPTPTITHQYALSSIPLEFPSVNPAYEMSSARYVYGCSAADENFGAALGKATKIDVLVKMDVETLLKRGEAQPPTNITGCVDYRSITDVIKSEDERDPIKVLRMPQGWYAQEPRFVSRKNAVAEDDGWLLFYAFDESQLDTDGECRPDAVSELWILDARDMRDVVAKVRLPQRVPYGLHGNWFPEASIMGQRDIDQIRSLPAPTAETKMGKMKSALISALA